MATMVVMAPHLLPLVCGQSLHLSPRTFDVAQSLLYYLGGIDFTKSATLYQEYRRSPARPLLEVSGGRDAALDGD